MHWMQAISLQIGAARIDAFTFHYIRWPWFTNKSLFCANSTADNQELFR